MLLSSIDVFVMSMVFPACMFLLNLGFLFGFDIGIFLSFFIVYIWYPMGEEVIISLIKPYSGG